MNKDLDYYIGLAQKPSGISLRKIGRRSLLFVQTELERDALIATAIRVCGDFYKTETLVHAK